MDENDLVEKEGGYIWHTTGSGKTVTSFKVAQLIASRARVEDVLFIVDSVISQMKNMPNISFIEIWLQRLSLVSHHPENYSDILCQKVADASYNIWNSEWLRNNFPEDSIIN